MRKVIKKIGNHQKINSFSYHLSHNGICPRSLQVFNIKYKAEDFTVAQRFTIKFHIII